MIRNKRALIKFVNDLGDKQIKRGLLLKELSFSIEQRKDNKTFKEWKEFLKENPIIKNLLIELEGGLKDE